MSITVHSYESTGSAGGTIIHTLLQYFPVEVGALGSVAFPKMNVICVEASVIVMRTALCHWAEHLQIRVWRQQENCMVFHTGLNG